ncbi:MAG: dual specificity protein phosphatase family protein [Chromatiales bacterium]|nr:dual specificity protein phosphatase family protein [Chromatiales bacterium]
MAPDDIRRIHSETGVSALLSLQHDDCLDYWGIDYRMLYRTGEELGLRMERCPIRDFDVDDMRRQLSAAVSLLTNLRSLGHQVYVHCTAGLGRSSVTVLGYLTLIEGLSPDRAIHLIRKGRPGAVPAWEAYDGFRNDMIERYRKAIERRAYELYESGVHRNANADWYQAQAEVLRSAFTHENSGPGP